MHIYSPDHRHPTGERRGEKQKAFRVVNLPSCCSLHPPPLRDSSLIYVVVKRVRVSLLTLLTQLVHWYSGTGAQGLLIFLWVWSQFFLFLTLSFLWVSSTGNQSNNWKAYLGERGWERRNVSVLKGRKGPSLFMSVGSIHSLMCMDT